MSAISCLNQDFRDLRISRIPNDRLTQRQMVISQRLTGHISNAENSWMRHAENSHGQPFHLRSIVQRLILGVNAAYICKEA